MKTSNKNPDFEFDFVISYASEDENFANSLVKALKALKARVFYAPENKAELWGANLYEHLATTYSKKGRFCIVLVSRAYVEKPWTRHEWKNAQERIIASVDDEYVLPIRLDSTELPGLPKNIAYLVSSKDNIAEIAKYALQKLYKHFSLREISPSHWTLNYIDEGSDSDPKVQSWHITIQNKHNRKNHGDFYAYSITGNHNLSSRNITVKIKSSLFSLMKGKSLPVLIHIYDFGTRLHYWTWFDETVQSQIDSDKLPRAKNYLHIPTSNIFNNTSYKSIDEKVTRFKQISILRKKAEIASRTDPNYTFQHQSYEN